ncbi:MAG: FKBP-type peptidyl-prolyl cis-trans isomerase [Chitinophagaceae bacterium]
MKQFFYSLLTISVVAFATSCNNISYERTKSGMLYKIIPSNSKDSIAKPGNWAKLYYIQKLNDSVLQNSYGKMPAYVNVAVDGGNNQYNPTEIFSLLKKGDSAVTIMLVDSMLRKGMMQELPPFMKKGDRMITSFKIVEVFRTDSAYQADVAMETERDAPRAKKEQEEQAAKMEKQMKEERAKVLAEDEKSGEAEKQRKVVMDYLAAKKINAQKTGSGTYVLINQQGSGQQVTTGKYVEVKYSGRLLATDSVFQANVYSFQIDLGSAIDGWHEGLKLFKEGGKGTLFIPGFLAYGRSPGPGNTPNEALIFDIEVLKVSDTPIEH